MIVGGFLRFDGFFDLHVPKLIGVKDLATIHALDKLSVFVPGNDSDPGVFEMIGIALDRLNKLLFPPDCSCLFLNLKPIFVESFGAPAIFSGNAPAFYFRLCLISAARLYAVHLAFTLSG